MHDSELFKPIDEPHSPASPVDAALHLYRAIAHELVKKQWVLELLSELSDPSESVTTALRAGTAWSVLALFEHLERLETVLLADRFGGVHVEVFESDEPANIVASSVWFPDFDFAGSPLQSLPTAEHVPALVGVFSVPIDSGSAVFLVWHRDSAWCVQRLWHSLASGDVDRIGTRLLHLVLVTSENVFLRPDWWEGLAGPARTQLIDFWNHRAEVETPIDPSYLNALSTSGIEWSVTGVRPHRDAG